MLFSVTWAFQLLISFFVNRAGAYIPFIGKLNEVADIKLFAVAAGLILFELAASVMVLVIIEQKNKVKVLKGGI